MRIQNNIIAMNTQRQLGIATSGLSGSAEKLSSGYRINRAGDDAAGLAISEKMRAQIRGLTMASKNSQDAISLVQTAEGALQSTHNILQRMRELAVQSASDTNEQSVDRDALNREFQKLKQEIDDTASKTRFNDQNLIDGTFQKKTSLLSATSTDTSFIKAINGISVRGATAGAKTIKVATVASVPAKVTAQGAAPTATTTGSATGALQTATITFNGVNTSAHNGNNYSIKVVGSDVSNMTFQLMDSNNKLVATSYNNNMTQLATGQKLSISFEGVGKLDIQLSPTTVASSGVITGNGKNDLTTIQSLENISLKFDSAGQDKVVSEAQKGYMSLEMDGEVIKLYKGDTVANFKSNGVSFTFDALSDKDISLGTVFGNTAGVDINVGVSQRSGANLVIQTGANQGDELTINLDEMSTGRLGIQFSSIASREDASKAITEVNTALNKVSTQRAELGALQNRLNYKIDNLETSAENLQAAESRIRDTDMAKEMTKFTKQNILIQAATAMLAQANQSPQNVLSLLR